jgi:hypothetical protein
VLWNRNHLLRFRSDFGKVSVPVPTLVPDPNPETDQDHIKAQLFNKKIGPNLAFFRLEAALFPRELASHFLFFCLFDFCIEYYVGYHSGTVS